MADLLAGVPLRFITIFEVGHDVGASRHRAAGQTASQDFRQCRDIGNHAGGRLRPTRRTAKTGDHFVHDEQHAVVERKFAHGSKNIRVERIRGVPSAGGLHNDGGNIGVIPQDGIKTVEVVHREHKH